MINEAKKSTAISSLVTDENSNLITFYFTSNPEKPYPYVISEGQFDFVESSFQNSESLGGTYHELVSKGIIAPLK